MVAKTRPAIDEAWGVVQYLSDDAKARRLAEEEEKARRDEIDRMEGEYTKGWQEGRQETIIEVARNALRVKMPEESIALLTGLSLDEVRRLAADFPPVKFA